jgi:hypothetical protein
MKTLTFIISLLIFANSIAQTPKTYTIKKSGQPKTIDGSAIDWTGAMPTEFFNISTSGQNGVGFGNAKMLWDDDNLYVFFHIDDMSIKRSNEAQDANLWQKGDVTEMILDFDGNGHHYLEMGINANGNFFDFNILCPSSTCGGWSDDKNWDIANIEIATKIPGSVDKQFEYGYDIEMKIPFASLATLTGSNFQMPVDGTQWRGNLMKVNYDKNASSPFEYLSWSTYPAGAPAFHQPDYFGYFTFSDIKVSTDEITQEKLHFTNLGCNQFSVSASNTLVNVYDGMGRKIKIEQYNNIIDLTSFDSGLYILEASNEKEKTTYKLIK